MTLHAISYVRVGINENITRDSAVPTSLPRGQQPLWLHQQPLELHQRHQRGRGSALDGVDEQKLLSPMLPLHPKPRLYLFFGRSS